MLYLRMIDGGQMRLLNRRYEEIKKTVIEMFEKYGIKNIPVDCFEICEKLNIKLIPYSKLTETDLEKAKEISKDGFCLLFEDRNHEQWYIFYDDTMPEKRIRFTIMHEVAHIVLDHTEHSELAESEANFFAGYALAPPLVFALEPNDFTEIADRFDLSYECALNAMRSYTKWLKYGPKKLLDYEIHLISLFNMSELCTV